VWKSIKKDFEKATRKETDKKKAVVYDPTPHAFWR
jgi:hypothetical protein